MIILGVLSYSTTKKELSHNATEVLIAVRDLKTARAALKHENPRIFTSVSAAEGK